MSEANEIIIPINASLPELNALLLNAISENAGQDVIGNIANKLFAAANEVQKQETKRLRIADLKATIANHVYGEKAIEILLSRNMTEELKDKLAPPDEVTKFLKLYDLKVDDGGTRICVSTKELNKCQKQLDEGRTLESITLEDLKKNDKAPEDNKTEDNKTDEI